MRKSFELSVYKEEGKVRSEVKVKNWKIFSNQSIPVGDESRNNPKSLKKKVNFIFWGLTNFLPTFVRY